MKIGPSKSTEPIEQTAETREFLMSMRDFPSVSSREDGRSAVLIHRNPLTIDENLSPQL